MVSRQARASMCACALAASIATAEMPPLKPLRGIAYGALPCKEHACAGVGQISEDMLQETYAGQWSASGRDDLGVIAKLGGNAVRLYHSLGLGLDSDHSGFLDRSAEVGVNVMAGFHTYNPCPGFDCFESWRNATLHGLRHGFRKGSGWHPAVSTLILQNEPDLVHPGSGAAGRIKLVLSALDGFLAAEKEAGVMPGRTRLTVTWSFAMQTALDGKVKMAGGWGFQDTATGIYNPEMVNYTSRCSREELQHAFRTRWVHGVNTQAPWDFVDAVIGTDEALFKPIPWFVGEYGANGQMASTIRHDLENIDRKSKENDMFLGAGFFQFQTAYFKGGSETNFGLFALGKQVLATQGSLPVYCLSTHLTWLPGTMADRASAVAAAWNGSLDDLKGLCEGGRRLAGGGSASMYV